MANKNGLYQIGEVAKKSGVSVDTVRYYEKSGLLEKANRTSGGFRLYSEAAIERLRFIKKAQEFGFTLTEIKQIMQQSRKGLSSCCDYVGTLFRRKLEELEIKIKELQRMRSSLKNLLKGWIPLKEAKTRSFSVCPQIETRISRRKKGGVKNVKKKR